MLRREEYTQWGMKWWRFDAGAERDGVERMWTTLRGARGNAAYSAGSPSSSWSLSLSANLLTPLQLHVHLCPFSYCSGSSQDILLTFTMSSFSGELRPRTWKRRLDAERDWRTMRQCSGAVLCCAVPRRGAAKRRNGSAPPWNLCLMGWMNSIGGLSSCGG